MKSVKVSKVDLLVALRDNRSGHRAIFEEALEGYKDTVLGLLSQHVKDVKAGKVKMIQVFLPEPEDHTKDYDRVIRMVEMSLEDELELDQSEFRQYVMDDWSWKNQFLTSNSTYSGTALAALGN